MDKIIRVDLINHGISFVEILAIISTILGILSALYVFYEKYAQRKMNLVVIPVDKASDFLKNYFFIKFIFLNESSTPLSLISFQIKLRNKQIPGTPNGGGGKSSFRQVDVFDLIVGEYGSTYEKPIVHDLKIASIELPVIVPPNESKSGYVAFNINAADELSVFNSGFTLEITTSKGPWENDIQVYSSNFADFSYRDKSFKEKSTFGKAIRTTPRLKKLQLKLSRLLKHNRKK